MSTLNFNFNEVPDVVLPVGPGIKRFQIKKAPEVRANAKDPAKQELSIELHCIEEGDDNGRMVFDNPLITNIQGKTKIKRLILSAGLQFAPDGSFDMNALVGSVVCVTIKNNNAVDKQTGVTKTFANVQDYLIPGDQGYNK